MKKAQLKMAENIAVLLIFFIIIAFGLIFYGVFQAGSIRESQREVFDREAVRIALTASYFPELMCTEDNHITENCMDMEKVHALSERGAPGSVDRDMFLFYESEFRDSKIIVQEVFPSDSYWVIYDNAPGNFTEMIPTFIPVTIKDPTRRLGKQYALGLLTVEVYR